MSSVRGLIYGSNRGNCLSECRSEANTAQNFIAQSLTLTESFGETIEEISILSNEAKTDVVCNLITQCVVLSNFAIIENL